MPLSVAALNVLAQERFRRPHSNREENGVDPELKLPKKSSLAIILLANALLQISFFIIVSSSNEYAQHLGGTATFSGIVIGIPTVFSGITLVPLMKYDKGGYALPLHLSCAASIVGLVLYASAYKANFLYLILIGRCVNGIGFAMWMYCKRYCSDPRLVGIRRRTTLASWLIIGNGLGMCLGPFLGGVFYRAILEWVYESSMGSCWGMGGVLGCRDYMVRDIQPQNSSAHSEQIEMEGVSTSTDILSGEPSKGSYTTSAELQSAIPAPTVRHQVAETSLTSVASQPDEDSSFQMSPQQWGVTFCMCWFALACFHVLGAWEANIPIFAALEPSLHFSPFASGNFLSLGALACFPFFILNVFLARRVQDRYTLAFGAGIGGLALLIFLILIVVAPATGEQVSFIGGYAGAFMCWFTVALGFNIASTVTMSLLSKQVPPTPKWNGRTSLAIQYSNFLGRVTGAIWGGSGVSVGMGKYVGVELVIVGVGGILCFTFWKHLKAKTG
ncbi:hypothetical protein VNI00_000780 [Paramarasmius palmivorus]|uniref:MFS general substrate transporter n=1 Tax=Paramarasmius palmivorus TaxID=297713 RepID=A0AAW0E786_9AGAR